MSYYIKSKIKNIDNRNKYGHFELYDDNELLRIFNKEESLSIIDKIKRKNIEPIIDGKDAFIKDQRFIEYVIKSKLKRNRINKKLTGIIISASLISILGGIKVNTDNNINHTTKNDAIEVTHNNYDVPIKEKQETINILAKPSKSNEYVEVINAIPDIKPEVFEFDSVDKSHTENIDYVNKNYKYMTDITSSNYGIDPALMNAIICVENPYNNQNANFVGGHGITQVEHINHNQNYEAFNFSINDLDYTGNIDVYRADYDQDYAIRVASIILSKQYNYLNKKYTGKFNDAEILMAAILSYNKGISIVDLAMSNTNSFDEFKYYITVNSSGGNNNYIENVLSYIEDETVLHMITDDKKDHYIKIDNINVNNDAPKSL